MTEAAEFARFVRENGRSLYGTALVLTGSDHAAEELLQDTLANLYPKWGRVMAAQSPLAYVRRAVTNRFVSGRRTWRRRDVHSKVEPAVRREADANDLVLERDALVRLLRTLSPRQQAALALRYVYDLPDDEIATSLGCSQATVRSLVSRGLATLRAQHDQRRAGTSSMEGTQR